MKKLAYVSLLAGLAMAAPAWAQDGLFNIGNLVVSQVGDGSAALGNTGTVTSLREYSLATGFVGTDSITMPTALSGSNRRLVVSGSATSEGQLTFSPNGQTLCYQGYDANLATAAIAGTTSASVNRVVAAVSLNLAVDTSTAWSDAHSGNNIRASIINGSTAYSAGAGNGVRSGPLGAAGTSTGESGSLTNARVVNIFGGSLYASSASGSFIGVSLLSGGAATLTIPTTGSGSGTPSPYDFLFTNSSTCYITDDRTNANGGGLQKWTFNGSTWSLAYTLNTGLTAGLRSVTVDPATGTIYAVSADSATKLVSVVDAGASSAFTTLATSSTNTAFRGVEFVAVPTPGTFALLSLGGLAMVRRRRR